MDRDQLFVVFAISVLCIWAAVIAISAVTRDTSILILVTPVMAAITGGLVTWVLATNRNGNGKGK